MRRMQASLYVFNEIQSVDICLCYETLINTCCWYCEAKTCRAENDVCGDHRSRHAARITVGRDKVWKNAACRRPRDRTIRRRCRGPRGYPGGYFYLGPHFFSFFSFYKFTLGNYVLISAGKLKIFGLGTQVGNFYPRRPLRSCKDLVQDG